MGGNRCARTLCICCAPTCNRNLWRLLRSVSTRVALTVLAGAGTLGDKFPKHADLVSEPSQPVVAGNSQQGFASSGSQPLLTARGAGHTRSLLQVVCYAYYSYGLTPNSQPLSNDASEGDVNILTCDAGYSGYPEVVCGNDGYFYLLSGSCDMVVDPAVLDSFWVDQDTDYPGVPLSNNYQPSAEACAQSCLNAAGCQGFVYDTYAYCWLTSCNSLSGRVIVGKEGYTSGTLKTPSGWCSPGERPCHQCVSIPLSAGTHTASRTNPYGGIP
jgi:hypothetical protein